MSKRFRWLLDFCGLCLLTALLPGCGGEPTGTVSGVVTLKGKPLFPGTITFIGEKSVKSDFLKKNGSYSVQVPTGPAKITISVPQPVNMPEGLKMDASAMGKKGVADPKTEESTVELPPEYTDSNKTPLNLNVEAGSQPHDIKIP